MKSMKNREGLPEWACVTDEGMGATCGGCHIMWTFRVRERGIHDLANAMLAHGPFGWRMRGSPSVRAHALVLATARGAPADGEEGVMWVLCVDCARWFLALRAKAAYRMAVRESRQRDHLSPIDRIRADGRIARRSFL